MNMICYYLFYSCLFLNRFSLFTRREETLQLSTLLVVLCYYKCLTYLQLVVLFSPEEGRTTQPIYGKVAESLQDKICVKDILPWVEYIFWILLHTASPESIALPRYAEDTSHFWGYQSHFLWRRKNRVSKTIELVIYV